MKYKLREDENTRTQVLTINEVDVTCPYQNSHLVPSNMGQIQLMRLPCNTGCAHVKYSADSNEYTITCGCEKKTFEVDKPTEERKSPLSIV